MQLEEFITNSLIEIDRGVRKANEILEKENSKPRYSIRSDKDRRISFDVAVTAGSNTSDGISVAAFGIGGKNTKEILSEAVSRIQFHVTPAQK